MDHEHILKKIQKIECFLKSIGFVKTRDLPSDWNLDSVIKYEPIASNFTIDYNGEKRVLINIDIAIMGGIFFVMSGKYGVSVFETIITDYDLVAKYEDFRFFIDEYRNWNIENVLE